MKFAAIIEYAQDKARIAEGGFFEQP